MITKDEHELLKKYKEQGYGWIAKDSDETTCVYVQAPTKGFAEWIHTGVEGFIFVTNELFNFIEWEDEEPTRITDLINEYEAYQEIKQHDKVVIPPFVAKFLEEQKDSKASLRYALDVHHQDLTTLGDFFRKKQNQELFARAWLDGYTVEQKRYEIPLPHLKTVDGTPQYLTHKGDRFFACLKTEGAKGYRQSWTEDELKLVPEEYRKYKVEVK